MSETVGGRDSLQGAIEAIPRTGGASTGRYLWISDIVRNPVVGIIDAGVLHLVAQPRSNGNLRSSGEEHSTKKDGIGGAITGSYWPRTAEVFENVSGLRHDADGVILKSIAGPRSAMDGDIRPTG